MLATRKQIAMQYEPRRKRLLIFADYFWPGFRAGGPIKSLQSILSSFGKEFEILIVTRNWDLGTRVPYFRNRKKVVLRRVLNGRVMYLSPRAIASLAQLAILKRIRYDGIYLNSFFSFSFSVLPVLFRRFFSQSTSPLVLAPRGEFSLGALAIKSLRKTVFLFLASRLRLYSGVVWQASTPWEQDDILRIFSKWTLSGRRGRVLHAPPLIVARDLSIIDDRHVDVPGVTPLPNLLRLIFLSRINRQKNLIGALRILTEVRTVVDFDIYGPIEDPAYWEECKTLIGKMPKNISVTYKRALPADEVQSVFAAYDGFLFPTFGENYGHVVLESLLAGCPVILSTDTPWRGLLNAGVGWDLDLKDGRAFVDAIESLAAMDVQQRLAMRVRARHYGENHITDSNALEQNRLLLRVATGQVALH
jgi:glycosyltransferase involved in cell wall biosynthesis